MTGVIVGFDDIVVVVVVDVVRVTTGMFGTVGSLSSFGVLGKVARFSSIFFFRSEIEVLGPLMAGPSPSSSSSGRFASFLLFSIFLLSQR
jgi:hypothetical protein